MRPTGGSSAFQYNIHDAAAVFTLGFKEIRHSSSGSTPLRQEEFLMARGR